ncbi:unnamed protein product, partial [marine sediment metagenome]
MTGEQTSVYAMVTKVLGDTREKLAAESSGSTKTAAAGASTQHQPPVDKIGAHNVQDLNKIADACDHLANSIHLVNDERTPQEKLAEYAAVYEAMMKRATESGDNDPNKQHQTQTSNPESDPPKTVTTDNSGTGVGGSTTIPSEATNTPGESMDTGESGEATGGHTSPDNTTPTEKPNPQDAATAMETNKEMLISDQPEDVLKQAVAVSPTFQSKVAGTTQSKAAFVVGLLEKAAASGVPAEMAVSMIRQQFGDEIIKAAEDALNPASVSSSTEPELQSEPGVPSPLMQGSAVGSNTPRETAPTTG